MSHEVETMFYTREKPWNAERELRKALQQLDNKTFVNPVKVTFADFLKDWMDNVIKSKVEPNTWQSYNSIYELHILPYFRQNNLSLQDIQAIHIQKYYEHKMNSSSLSGNTIRRHHACINGVLQYALRMNLIPFNAAKRVLLPPKKLFTGSYYTTDQLEKLLAAVANTPVETAVFITAYYGLGRSEILGLKWSAIDFEEGTLSIHEARVRYMKGTLAKKPKNKSSERILPLIKNIEDYLKDLKKKHKQLYGKDYIDNGYICCFEDGTPMSPAFLNRTFKSILKKNELPHIRFHDIRHTTASLLLKLGFSMKEIQVWLGHGDISTIMNIYTHVDLNMKNTVAKKLNSIFKENIDTEN